MILVESSWILKTRWSNNNEKMSNFTKPISIAMKSSQNLMLSLYISRPQDEN